MRKMFRTYLFSFLLLLIPVTISGCKSCKNERKKTVRIFAAAVFSPVLKELADTAKTIDIKYEISGSQAAVRKITELGRSCDVLMLADNSLFSSMASEYFKWRIDFSGDEMVLSVGKYAPHVDKVQEDWIETLVREDIVLGRVDERLGPAGYRTLLLWKAAGKKRNIPLMETLKEKSARTTDHVAALAALLRNGIVHYGFLYRTISIRNDIRFIKLPTSYNFSKKSETLEGLSIMIDLPGDNNRKMKVNADPALYSVSIPENAENRKAAVEFLKLLLNRSTDILEKSGFRLMDPVFHGPSGINPVPELTPRSHE